VDFWPSPHADSIFITAMSGEHTVEMCWAFFKRFNLSLTVVVSLFFVQPYGADLFSTINQASHHIFLLIGQSNMAGRAPWRPEDVEPQPCRTFLLDNNGNWITAKEPCNAYSTIRKDLDMQGMGPGTSFARTIENHVPSISIGLVVNARGGSAISEWKKGTPYYSEAVLRTREAMKTGTLKAVLWHQGESDLGNSSYLGNLTAFIRDLRADLGFEKLPFVAGELVPEKNKLDFNKRLSALPDTVEYCAVVSSDGLVRIAGESLPHFDAASQRLLGQRYGEAVVRLAYTTASFVKQKSDRSTNTETQLQCEAGRYTLTGQLFPFHTSYQGIFITNLNTDKIKTIETDVYCRPR
jgi:hypothetical protein